MSTSADLDRSSVARVATDRPARYGKQLASHMSHKITTSWDADAAVGELVFDRGGAVSGRVDVSTEDGALVLALHAPEPELERLEYVAGIHLARFGVEDQLAVSWVRDDGSAGTSQGPLSPEELAELKAKREARLAREAAEQSAPGA